METKSLVSRRLHRTLLAVVFLVATACTQTPRLPEPRPLDVTADEIAASARTADVVADATLEEVRPEQLSDAMEATLVWTVTRCHVGSCDSGMQFKTRFSLPSSTNGAFCSSRHGCVERNTLESFRGERFLVTFSREPYVAQVEARQGVPLEGLFSLNRGFYLIQGGRLYRNDRHRLVDADYQEVMRLITKE